VCFVDRAVTAVTTDEGAVGGRGGHLCEAGVHACLVESIPSIPRTKI